MDEGAVGVLVGFATGSVLSSALWVWAILRFRWNIVVAAVEGAAKRHGSR